MFEGLFILGLIAAGIAKLFSSDGSCSSCGGSGRYWDVSIGTTSPCHCTGYRRY